MKLSISSLIIVFFLFLNPETGEGQCLRRRTACFGSGIIKRCSPICPTQSQFMVPIQGHPSCGYPLAESVFTSTVTYAPFGLIANESPQPTEASKVPSTLKRTGYPFDLLDELKKREDLQQESVQESIRKVVAPNGRTVIITSSQLLDSGEDLGDLLHELSKQNQLKALASMKEGITQMSDGVFSGNTRVVPKTSVVDANLEVFYSIEELRVTLQQDDLMWERVPPIDHGETSQRVTEEKRNVRVKAFLFAASKEIDNDYRLVLSDVKHNPTAEQLITAEISGIPNSGPHRSKLLEARSYFESFVNRLDGGPQLTYSFYENMPVWVEGSLFFDTEHRAGMVGPGDFKPNTSWEIHPVTRIEFIE